MNSLIALLKILQTEYIERKIGNFGCYLYSQCDTYVAIHPNFFKSGNPFNCYDWDEKTCNNFLERLIMDMQMNEIYGNYFVMFHNENKAHKYYMLDVTTHYVRTVGPTSKENFLKMSKSKS